MSYSSLNRFSPPSGPPYNDFIPPQINAGLNLASASPGYANIFPPLSIYGLVAQFSERPDPSEASHSAQGSDTSRGHALMDLSKKREQYEELALVLWHSYGSWNFISCLREGLS